MSFKLVRVDTSEALKIKLPIGKHIIGRGSFLNSDNINDKRVSRRHAELEVTKDLVTIKSFHQNPCFYIKKNLDSTQILKQNETATLGNGDRFGILPQTYWYEVIYCTLDGTAGMATDEFQSAVHDNSESTDIVGESADLTDCDLNDSESNSQSLIATGVLEGQSLAYTEVNQDQPPTSRQVYENQSSINAEINQDQPTNTEDNHNQTPAVPDTGISSTTDETLEATKRLHSEDENEVASKKIRTDPPDDVKPIPSAAVVKDEPADADTAGPSNDQGGVSNARIKDGSAPSSPAKPNPPPRERCMYGANCYRRNPQHKAEFSHPSDSDWGAGEKGVCPYGSACRKRDPRHWLHHDHPPGVQPPPNAPPPGMRVVERHGNIFYINANNVNFYDDHFEVENSEGDSVDYDYEF